MPLNKNNEYVVKFLKGNKAAKHNVDLVGKMFNIQDLLEGKRMMDPNIDYNHKWLANKKNIDKHKLDMDYLVHERNKMNRS